MLSSLAHDQPAGGPCRLHLILHVPDNIAHPDLEMGSTQLLQKISINTVYDSNSQQYNSALRNGDRHFQNSKADPRTAFNSHNKCPLSG